MRQSAEAAVNLSVLDRLIDFDPDISHEPALTRLQSLKQLRAAVRRDLEWLLNSRRIAFEPDPGLSELSHSLYVMGLADFMAFSLPGPKEQSQLLRHIQSVIQQSEPRLVNIRITQKDDPVRTRSMRFRIEASLLIEPAPERISFDIILELSSGACIVREES
jgi:type VI secretion system protein ImpF